MNKNIINVYDNFLSKEEYEYILDYCFSASYCYGESDLPSSKPTGMVHDVYDNIEQIDFFNLFKSKIKQKFSSVIESKKLHRMYINCFASSENPYFHTDGEGYTFLYYANDTWDVNDGGETQFFIDGNLYGIPPIPNRMVVFDANILHKATSFRNRHRFTVAIKYR